MRDCVKILYIIGDPIDTKTSTTSFKKTILNELLMNSHEVTVIEYSKKNYSLFKKVKENGIEVIKGSKYIYFIDTIISKLDSKFKVSIPIKNNKWNKIYPEGYLRTLTSKLEGDYDVILSVSHPVYTHRIAHDLITKGKITFRSWNQVWFETWFDYFNDSSKSNKLIMDEKKLLKNANNIFYASDLLLEEHEKLYPDLHKKMHSFDLPAYSQRVESDNENEFLVGYFGSYDSRVRNIKPLYNSLKSQKYRSVIIGNSDLDLNGTNDLMVLKKRLQEEEVFSYEQNTSILVVLSNWFADVIPGKIYKYASWDKPILIILDGSDRLKKYLVNRFSSYEKIYISENNPKDITKKIEEIKKDLNTKQFLPIRDFEPSIIVKKLLEKS